MGSSLDFFFFGGLGILIIFDNIEYFWGFLEDVMFIFMIECWCGLGDL